MTPVILDKKSLHAAGSWRSTCGQAAAGARGWATNEARQPLLARKPESRTSGSPVRTGGEQPKTQLRTAPARLEARMARISMPASAVTTPSLKEGSAACSATSTAVTEPDSYIVPPPPASELDSVHSCCSIRG
eukprot:CAMPEP_0168620942 /NCGR_PEP_ID=MMETSP0449_2-20121227/7417_1 /TAXON_ID=1082188 /ORGANISM="Strombidium rassoulzadegani, Strain ras09" /LENGTH=132 /DNA_ID=CAMNT_0008662003 /DNA_START=307 /DNA_END=706 /DNA_ORIENTATION=-